MTFEPLYFGAMSESTVVYFSPNSLNTIHGAA
jgi:hypothetical protein